MKLSATVLTILVGTSCASAADVDFVDLRLGAGALSNSFMASSNTEVSNGNASWSTTDGRDADKNYRGQLQLVHGSLGSAGGLITGIGIALNHARFSGGGESATVNTPTIDVMVGYGLAVTQAWHFELTPFAGYGRAYSGNSTANDWTSYVEYGARLGTYYTFSGHSQLGIEVPYLIGRFDPSYSHGNGSYNVRDDGRNEGLGMLVTIGTRF